MNYSFIRKYIPLITKDKIIAFGQSNEIYLSNKEVDIIYSVINNEVYIDKLLNGKEEEVFTRIKPYLNKNNYDSIIDLFNKYKNKFL